jgi:mono/diheme cytochrome c family protein
VRGCGLGFLVAFAAAAAPARKPPKRTPGLIEQGKATYGIYCVACHGERGAGDGSAAARLNQRPRNFATDKFRQGDGVTQIFETLGKGVPGTPMVKYTNLSEDDRWALAWYVLDLKAGK